MRKWGEGEARQEVVQLLFLFPFLFLKNIPFFFVRILFHRVSLTWNYRIYTHIHTVWNFKLFDKSIIGRAKLCRVGGRRVVALGWDSVHFDDLINTESSANWIRVA